MANLSTTTPGMTRASQTIDNTKTNIDRIKTTVDGEVNGLVWTGDAATGYKNAFQPWVDSVTQIMRSLENMSNLLVTNRDVITRNEAANVDTTQHMGTQVGLNL
ncbi:MAG: WXG100 family type VII secretion target [Janthinobacterium lividum]